MRNKFAVHLKLSQIEETDEINLGPDTVRVRVDHTDKPVEKNLIELARMSPIAKFILVALANRGYFLIRSRKGYSDFVKSTVLTRLRRLKAATTVMQHREVFYTLTPAAAASSTPRLLVVFCSVADISYATNIARRNFFQNFPNIQKYVPANTAVLRISDLGSVVGSFYLNNKYSSMVEESVQNVIAMVVSSLGACREDVVLYGASKGGTGALYHGTLGGYKAVAVDPIVSDEYYEAKKKDQHFTATTFDKPKQERFRELFDRVAPKNITIIRAPRSPQYEYIQQYVAGHPNCDGISYFETCHPLINDHPDVGPNTVNALTMLLNGYFYGLLSDKLNFERDLCGGSACSAECLRTATGN